MGSLVRVHSGTPTPGNERPKLFVVMDSASVSYKLLLVSGVSRSALAKLFTLPCRKERIRPFNKDVESILLVAARVESGALRGTGGGGDSALRNVLTASLDEDAFTDSPARFTRLRAAAIVTPASPAMVDTLS